MGGSTDMTTVEFLSSLQKKGIKIWVEGDQLNCRGPKGVITEVLKQEILERKIEILAFVRKAQTATQSTSFPLVPVSRDGELSLSFAQQRMWFLYQLDRESPFYNESLQVRIVGKLSVTALEQSINEIIRRHEALRTTFTVREGIPFQAIPAQSSAKAPTFTINIPVVDLQGLPQASVKQIVTQEVRKPFELGTDPLLRVTLLRQEVESYLLILTMHHIITDGWSMGIFFKELTTLYQAFTQDTEQPNPLPELTLQYADFALWQRQWLTGEVLEKQLDYWKQQLADAPPLLELPTDYPRPSVQTFSGATQKFQLEQHLTSQLVTLSQKSGVTLFMTLLAAFAILLHRYSGQDDICIGSPFANRNRQEVNSLIGFFVNTLVLRTQIEDNPSFSQFLQQVRSVVSDAHAHQDIPFEQVVEALQPERSLSYNPLFQVMFVLENFSLDTLELPGITLTPEMVERGTSQFDLSLSIWETQKGLIGSWEYNSDLFERDTIARMTLHFQTLLETIVSDPNQRIGELPLLTQSERHQLLVEWNSTQADYPEDRCIHQLFEEQVQCTPEAVAVVYGNQQLTYEQLNCRANQWAHYLQSMGVKPDTLVGICVERSIEMVVGLLGILKAGGAYVPLDPDYPTERLNFMLEDAQVRVLLTQHHLIDRLSQSQVQVVCLDTDSLLVSQLSQENPITGVQASNLAYVIYTSGSTGKPKGTMILHQGVVNYLFWCTQAYAVGDRDGAPVQSSFAFDATITSLFSPLIVGKKVVVLPQQQEMEALCDVLQSDYDFSLVKLTPAHLELLNQLLPSQAAAQTKALVIGGEQLLGKTIELWRKNTPNTRLINEYGPTETVVGCCFYEVTNETSLKIGILIGRPIANTQIYILDQYLQPVPVGVPGELHIGGAGLARGYLNRTELTEEKFIPNPFNNSKFKLYKTGDLARYLPDGNIEYLGRIDNQVKIRGFRIELGEIEAVLSQHPHVQTCCVIVREDTSGDKRLVAYVVAKKEVACITSELRQFVDNKLPLYMMPSAFVMLEFLPLTPNGKVDRRALPAPDLYSEQKDKYVAARTLIEELLAQIWAQVLKVDQVGIHDNFFELGGHSLLATQLISRIRTSFKVELPLRELFAKVTVAQLARSLEQLQQQDLKLSAPPILPRATNAELLLSYAQQRLWFLDQLQPNSAFYNIPLALRLIGQLQVAALEQSLKEIIVRHEALRTNFTTIDGQPTQIIQAQTNWILSVIDWQHLPRGEQESALQQLIEQQAIQPFDLASVALIRATLIVLSETEHVLSVCMHHIVSDGWSMGVFVQELTALYNAYSIGKTSPLTPLPIQYGDFAIWQRNWLLGDVLQTQLSYWQQQLKDAPALLSLPTDRPRPAVQTFAGAHQEFALSGELTHGLTKLSYEQGCTLFMTLLAAFDTLLYRYTGVADILVGTPIANRDRSEIEGLIGFFVNTLVMRSNLAGNPSFSELLGRVREIAMSAYIHQNLPFEMLVEALQPERDLSHTPLFQVMFALGNAPMSGVELTGLTVSPLNVVSTTAKFDLTLSMENTATGLVGVWEYNTDLFDDSTIERMTGHFVTLLSGIVANPIEQISQLPMLTDLEQQQLLVEWNSTQADYPEDRCIHQLFEEQVQCTPEAVAVVYGNQQLTYEQLNCRANQWAHYLQSMGVKPDTLVGICVERSIEMVVGLLGILKAGGAYVPLDPDYPTERLNFMLEDAQVRVLLTQHHLIDRLSQSQVQVVCLDTDSLLVSQLSQENPITGVQASNLAYVIYTSGSTGKPKGTMILHQGVVNYLFWCTQAYAVGDRDGAPVQSSFAFDATITSLFSPLIVGKKVVVLPQQQEMEALCDVLQSDYDFSLVKLTPAHLELLNQLLPSQTAAQTKALVIGGEQLLGKTIELWRKNTPNTRLINEYGPTETVVGCCFYEVTNETSLKIGILIGRPIANTQIYILDQYLQPVPVGVPGELHIGGAGLARGYLNRTELTQEKFIPNRFSTDSGSRLYKTGDLARYLPDGNIEYLGRIDNQVKIRGFRIELGEIEAVLRQHPHVQSCCAIVREDTTGDQRLVAYVVADRHSTLTISELRQFLKTKLPEYMVPSAFVMLEEMPLTSNGKVDRRALPAPDGSSEHLDQYVAPRTPIEELLAHMWAQVLKVDQVGIADNFFELGGHSLLATQLVSRIRTGFKVELPLRELFATKTLAELAQAVEQLQQQDLKLSAPPILPRAINAELLLSYAQQRLWFLDQLQPNSAFYNIPVALHLVGQLQVTALEQSLQEIIHRHEALRTNFITVDGQPTQIIQTQTNWTLSIIDCEDLPTSDLLAQQQAIQPFDLASVALIRATLIVLSETEHVLSVCMHHIVSDGWSTGVFVQELAALYNAYSIGKTSPLTPLPIQYGDFAIWQRNWLLGDVLQTQLSYWQQQLKDAPALLSLPTDRPRPAVQTFAGAHQEFALSGELTHGLTKLSYEQGSTLFMTLLAAFDTLLYRYTGVVDILVGTPIANRDRNEIEGLIGFFVNTLVMRSNLAGNPSFSELLGRVREIAMSAYTHQNLPFEMLVEALQPERDLSHTPLFQVMFALGNAPMSDVELTGLTVTPLIPESATAKFDLTLSMQNTATGLVGVWEYNTDLFDLSTIERMTGHFVTLLSGIVANPGDRISQLPMLTQVEQQQLLVDWNSNRANYPLDKCLHQLFESQVQRTPDAVAVVYGNVQTRAFASLTYQQLNCRANQLAHYLQSMGVKPDTLVGICVERSIEMVVGVLGILKAGGAYVPLDPEYPSERIKFMLEDSGTSVLLTQSFLLDQLPLANQQKPPQVICLDQENFNSALTENPSPQSTPDSLAYVIYTSGSTGQPKGVMIEHQAIVNLALVWAKTFQVEHDSRLLQFGSFSFDLSVAEIATNLVTGACLYLGNKVSLLPSQSLVDFLTEHKITHSFLSPSALSVLPWASLPDLQCLTVGGEACTAELVSQWGRGRRFYNCYGPTESTVNAAIALVQPNGKKPTIGKPLSNICIYILDEYLQPVPIGVPGELHIGGTGLARGYLKRPDLTAEKFIPNPFESAGGSKLYKTGDLARYLPDGNIEYLGRIDNQVKVRGFRIELGEIEELLNQHGDLQASCVMAYEDRTRDKRLVAYVVPDQHCTPTISELRQYLKAKLPEYMIPNAFVILQLLPLTPSGKVDRRALPAPDLYIGRTDKYVAPRTPTEELLAHMWGRVLKVEQVGINDNFFELGGHSLLATQLVLRIRTSFKVELPLRELFATQTLAELAQAVEQLQQQNLELSVPPILARATNVELPLSYAQQRLWFLDQLQPNSAFYNIPVALRIVGTLDQVALERSLQEIIHRHEALRTNFITVDGQPLQIIQNTRELLTVSIVDFQHLSTTEQEIAGQQLAQQQAIEPFDLAKGALIRATLVVLNETKHILLVCMHHVVSDAWSMGVFVEELAQLYNAYSIGQPSPLAPLLIQYADFAIWQRNWLQGDVLQTQLSYWQQQLKDAPALLVLPTDRPRPAVQTFAGAHQEFALSQKLTQRLIQLSQQQGCTLFMTLLAAFDTLLYRYTGVVDILVGTPIANRDRSEIEGLIGFFVNTLVMRTNLADNPSFSELLTRVREIAMSAYTHQNLPFEMLVEALQPERNLSYTPLFQVMFVLENAPMSNVELTGLSVTPLMVESTTAKFDLTLGMHNSAAGLVGVWEYNTDLFDASTIERISRHFVTMLEGIVTNPKERISQIPLLTQSEQQQLLVEWNDAQVDYSQDKCIHQLFEEQVQRTPDAVAVVFENVQTRAFASLTYNELNCLANQLAHYLRSLGVKSGMLVGLCVERSLEMLVGLLGILKAGGAYVPLDPDYPTGRLAYMLNDSQLSVLLTQEKWLTSLPQHTARVVCLDKDWENISNEGKENPVTGSTTDNLAYVIYTSGSTGQPKGTLVNHSNVVRLFAATELWYKFNQDDVWTLFHSYAFDFSVWEIWGALLYGGRLVVVPYLVTRSPESFYQLLCQEQVTILNQTPSAFRQLIQAEQSGVTLLRSSDGREPPLGLRAAGDLNLRLVIFGGEALELKSLQPWFERHGDQMPQLVNMYGITETTVHVTYRPLSKADLNHAASVIGRPIPDLQVYVLDQHLQPMPIGVPGEMYVGGAGVARGYLNRPELTAQRFMDHPFSSNPQGRLYKTGDLARYLPNGELEYLGRIDQQVKIRGFRIELGEIEALLVQHPAVWESVVVVREDEAGNKRLVAYIVPKTEQSPSTVEIRRFLKQKLPEYMIPSAFVQLEALPLTANGKVDKSALPKPDSARPELEDVFVAPSTPEEKILTVLWAKVLGVENVGINDNFFALGGDSIRSIQVVSGAKEQGLSFSVQQLFQHQTIHELVQDLKTRENKITKSELTQPFSLISGEDKQQLPSGVEDAYPLAMLQMGMIYHSEYSQDSAIYREISSFHLKTPLDVQLLQVAVQDLVNHHPVLRTSFELSKFSIPLQLVYQQVEIPLQVEDWCHLNHCEQEKALAAWFEAEKKQHFDWTHPPLIRFFVHRRTQETFNLTFSCHHAILDGWSVASMMSELLKRYLSLRRERIDDVSPQLSIAFRDFVALEQQALASSETQQYWSEKLNGRTFTKLPRWSSMPTNTDVQEVGVKEITLSPKICEDLRKLAQSVEVPVKSVLLAAHLRVLNLLSGQSDILTGLTANGRPEQSDGERVLGLFLNTLPFRLQLAGGTWIDLVRQVFEAERELLPHRRYPLAEIQRNLGGEPLFETAFNFVHFHVYQQLLGLDNLQILGGKFFEETNFTFIAQFSVNPSSSEVGLQFQYDALKLCPEQINRIGEYYLKALVAMASEPNGRYELHSLLSLEEQQQLLVEWNRTKADYPEDRCIHQLFEEQVDSTPDAVAIVFVDALCGASSSRSVSDTRRVDQQLTYRELNAKANQLAHYLRSLGVSADVLVGICVERSLEMVVGLLGILKAGGAYVPLDPEYPQDRLEFMLEDAQVRVLLTQQQLLEKLSGHEAQLVCLDTDAQLISQFSQDNPIAGVRTANLAYVIYTSGSTGKPKGVLIPHDAIANHCCIIQQTYALVQSDRVLQFASINFDASLEQIFPTLMVGATLTVRGSDVWDLTNFQKIISDFGLTVVNLPTAYWQQLAQESVKTQILDANSQLRLVVVGGDLMLPEFVALWQQSPMSCARLLNAYGPTEATITATLFEIPPQFSQNTNLKKIPIGRALLNKTVYILDEHLQPVPVAVPGELHIGGASLAQGYFNRPELTLEKFIPNPFKETGESKLYKTGDLARYLPDGNIEYLGRIDNQVKIRGFRIEPGEIEAILGQHEDVQACCVNACEDNRSDKRLVAYIVPQQLKSPTISELRAFLKSKLPEYMVPSAFVILKSLPLTPNGKVDRRALPLPDPSRELSDKYVAPRTPVEEILAHMWAQVLRVEQIGIDDNFFTLGGHSLLATQLISRVRTSLVVELPLRSLFAAPTIAELSRHIQQLQHQNLELSAPAILPRGKNAELLLSYAQQRLWFLDQLQPNSALYNIPTALRLVGNLNQAALERSLIEIIHRHEALRTNFSTVDGQPLQIIQNTTELLTVSIVDFKHLSTTEQEIAVGQLAQQQAIEPFDLAKGALIRTTLVVLHETEHILLVCMHHIVSDGWSMGVFVEELAQLYNAYLIGQPSPLAPLPIQYADFAIWQRNWLQGDVLQSQLSYWQQQLANAPALLSLPADRPRPAVQTFAGAYQEFTLSKQLTNGLTQLSQQQGCTLFMTLLAAFDTLLYRYTGVADILVGTPIANRDRSEIEGLIGFFVNTLVMRTNLAGNPSFSELLTRVRDMAMSAYAHQNLPFEMLVEALQPQRDLSHTPLFQVMFALGNAPMSDVELTGITVSSLSAQSATAKFDLTLGMHNTADGLVGVWEYSTDLFDASTIERMTGHFVTLLEGIVANSQQQISQLPMLTQTEQHQLLVEWNNTQADYPQDKCIHQLFEEQVQRTPDAVAVVFENVQTRHVASLTYNELNCRANQLAHYLQSLGVEPDVLVGICVERSLEMVVGLLGILKAGAAYIPLDPAYPNERLAFMLSNSQTAVLLSQQRLLETLPQHEVDVVCLDTNWEIIATHNQENPKSSVTSNHLAYTIYTSGSTGLPKGVMVSHGNVMNFFTGMDKSIGCKTPGVWLAVTSISFDISVLELFWTVTRGFQVIIQGEQDKIAPGVELDSKIADKKIEFSLFYFANHEQQSAKDNYKLLLEGAKFADKHGFCAIWTPERHFHAFGGLYPNPSVTSAALAAITEQIQIRAGSVVLPLHNPIRVAEEWAFVDNLSEGRVGISFATGWHSDDFVLSPENYAERKEVMFRGIETVRKLWRGESVCFPNGTGQEVEVQILPQPIQKSLPTWITAAGNPETFRLAGEIGANLLTHLLGQSIEELAEKIAIYRNAWQEHGHKPGTGHVTIMLHTFVGSDVNVVREAVREPFCNYLKSSISLVKNLARNLGQNIDSEDFGEDDMKALLSHAFDRYFETSALFGTPSTCLETINRLKTIGVDEVGCLIDFGVDFDSVMSSLHYLDLLKNDSNKTKNIDEEDYSFSTQIAKYSVSHMQCTPSMAGILTASPKAIAALQSLQKLILGGEALSVSLAHELAPLVPTIYNLYGPTETTIWSTSYPIVDVSNTVPIGRPIANTQIYILDSYLQPVPIGVPGELYIGGAGLTRGYLNARELTQEKFIPNPFSVDPHSRLYKTGDLARYLPDGNIEYLERIDNQVKVRGFRIELGEIEAVLNQHSDVQASCIFAREDSPGDKRLVAYVVPHQHCTPTISELRHFLKLKLPKYMVPNAFVMLESFPLTPNGKIDRRALPVPSNSPDLEKFVAPRNQLELQLVQIWSRILKVDKVGVQDNFFDLGGHSLLAVYLMTEIKQQFSKDIPLATLFQNPTIEQLVTIVEEDSDRSSWSRLVAIQPNGSKPPLFCLPGAGGNPFYLYNLARCLGTDQPFYSFQENGFSGELELITQVEYMAAQYIQALQVVQPQGPYFLAGHSVGGIVAFEMAQQLLCKGHEVALVAILDARAPFPQEKPIGFDWDNARWLTEFARVMEVFYAKNLDISDDTLQSLVWEEQLKYVLQRLKNVNILPPDYEIMQLNDLVQVYKANSLINYVPQQVYPTPITLLRASETAVEEPIDQLPSEALQDSTWGWSKFSAQPVDLHFVPGNHVTMMTQPHIQVLAERLKACIQQAQFATAN